ncbi:hypothetical protein SK128_008806 [Halocaridina rubra]|uniref:Uncharacterized protein n=1 Tax=Halocaridina rubra TaxID=373956 RepID=A0AAN9ACA1_HALRR
MDIDMCRTLYCSLVRPHLEAPYKLPSSLYKLKDSLLLFLKASTFSPLAINHSNSGFCIRDDISGTQFLANVKRLTHSPGMQKGSCGRRLPHKPQHSLGHCKQCLVSTKIIQHHVQTYESRPRKQPHQLKCEST